ncbi:hypothetical protein D3C79_966060 [compost metagenome]
MVHIHINAVQLTAATFDKIIAPGNARAHFLQHIGEFGVALNAFLADSGHAYGAAFNRRRRQEVRRGGCITFYQVISR